MDIPVDQKRNVQEKIRDQIKNDGNKLAKSKKLNGDLGKNMYPGGRKIEIYLGKS